MDWKKLTEILAVILNGNLFSPSGYLLNKIETTDYNLYLAMLEETNDTDVNIYIFLTQIKTKYNAFIHEKAFKTNASAASVMNEATAKEFAQLF